MKRKGNNCVKFIWTISGRVNLYEGYKSLWKLYLCNYLAKDSHANDCDWLKLKRLQSIAVLEFIISLFVKYEYIKG